MKPSKLDTILAETDWDELYLSNGIVLPEYKQPIIDLFLELVKQCRVLDAEWSASTGEDVYEFNEEKLCQLIKEL